MSASADEMTAIRIEKDLTARGSPLSIANEVLFASLRRNGVVSASYHGTWYKSPKSL